MRSARLVLAGALMLCAYQVQAQTLSAAEFRDRLAASVAQVTGHPTVVVDERTFKGRDRNGEEMTFFIDNAFQSYVADPSRLDVILQRFSSVVPETDKNSDSIDQLVVIVRPTDYIVRNLGPTASRDQFVAPRAMAGDLSFFLAIDSPEAIRTASRDDLKRWGLDEKAAWSRATANLKQRIGPLTPFRLSDAGAMGWGAESGLAPSVLADPAMCGPASPTGMGGQVVLVIGRDAFLVAPAGDRALTDAFWTAVHDGAAAQDSLSATPLTCRDGKWAVTARP